ncbi:MAG: hypothetical protein L0212_03745 [Acidobacteria bacterium]|nr:hypothetical protein [Acidobacteriota bacterium]
MIKPRPLVLMGLILMAAAARLLPHPPNFTPIAAMALFGGAHFAGKRSAFLVPLAAMLLSDLVIGLHPLMPVVYASFALIVCIGFWLRMRRRTLPIAGAGLASSLLFFLVTNFGVWTLGSLYAKTPQGLLACYVAAIPFFANTLLSDAVYTVALFGGFRLIERGFSAVREPAVVR